MTSDLAREIANELKPQSPQPESVRRKNLNPTLNTPMDLQSHILIPQTGRAKVGEDLSKQYKVKFSGGDEVSLWDLFSAITSDTRMSNLDPNKPEYAFVQWGMDAQLKFMQAGLKGSAGMTQGMVLAVTEPTMGKNMAFFKNIQTVRQESQHVQVEDVPKSRSIFGFLKGKGGSNG